MPFADADFLVALIKDDDWLKEKASTVYQKYKGTIWTSGFVIAEILLISKRLGLDVEIVVANIYRIVEVRGLDPGAALLAAHYIKENGANVFDAIHAAGAQHDLILSSDKIYDELGLDRLKLESK